MNLWPMLVRHVLPVCAGFALDLLLGDPPWLYHPVRLIGRLIERLETALRCAFLGSPAGLRKGGIVLAVAVPAASFAVPAALLLLAGRIHPWLGWGLEAFFCYQILAARSLCDETMKVYRPLQAGDLPAAREALSMVVGRDTARLDESCVARAAVETVAENTSDGVIAPLFYLLLGGSALGWCYKAVNTLDSMVGYKNDRYLDFGRASARLDDLANWLPARISAGCMLLASAAGPYGGRNALRVFRRDRFAHASPNSAQTEAVCAGALGLELGGDSCYHGKLVHKPTIGDPVRSITPEDILRANRLMLAAACTGLVLLTALKCLVLLVVTRI